MNKDIRKYQASKSNAQGHIFEQYIERACTIYRDRNIAHIIKVPEPFRVTKKLQNGIFQGRFIAKAEPDFQGTLSSGQSIVFEAKHTLQDKILQSVLTDMQIKSLLTHESLGARTGVCASIQDEFFFIPVRIWSNMKELYGRKYVRAEDIQNFKVKFNGAVMFLDYVYKD